MCGTAEWPSHPLAQEIFVAKGIYGISFTIGNGSESDAGDIVNSVSAAVDGLPNLTAFLEEMHDPTTFSQWHCWHHGNHSWIDAADGLLYESELDLPDLLIDRASTRKDTSKTEAPHNYLCGASPKMKRGSI